MLQAVAVLAKVGLATLTSVDPSVAGKTADPRDRLYFQGLDVCPDVIGAVKKRMIDSGMKEELHNDWKEEEEEDDWDHWGDGYP